MIRREKQTGIVRRHAAGGFTLVELLVVVAIMGMLMALLIPAVNAARGAARKNACSNNIRQVGIGILNFESALGRFPEGQQWVSRRPPNNVSYSWAAALLPYIEEQATFDALDFKKSFLHPANLPAASRVVSIYICPSTSRIEKHRDRNHQITDLNGIPGSGLGCIDYLGISGPSKSEKNPMTGADYGPQRGILLGTKGTPNEDTALSPAPLRAKDITDGLSHTICMAECTGRGLDSDGDFNGTWVSGRNIGHVAKGPNSEKPPKVWNKEHIFSDHAGGANSLACDGSVHFLATGTDKLVILSIVSRDGGETLDRGSF